MVMYGYMDTWIYGNDDLLIASEAPKFSFNVVISKQAVVFIGTILAIVPANYFKQKTSIVKIELTEIYYRIVETTRKELETIVFS